MMQFAPTGWSAAFTRQKKCNDFSMEAPPPAQMHAESSYTERTATAGWVGEKNVESVEGGWGRAAQEDGTPVA